MGRETMLGLQAGLLGGLAEVIWIGAVAPLSGGDPATVARGVTETVAPAMAAAGGLAVGLGLAIHFFLAAVLGIALVLAVRRLWPERRGTAAEAAAVVVALSGVWALNFLVVLPIVNPDFVHIVPLAVSLVSKLLFGLVAAAFMLWRMRSTT